MPTDRIKRKAKLVLDNADPKSGSSNMPMAQLDATLELSEKLDALIEAVANIPQTEIPEFPAIPEHTATDLSEVTSLLSQLVDEYKKPCQITLRLS